MGLIIIAYFIFKNNIKKIGDPFILKLFNTLKLFGLSKSKCMMIKISQHNLCRCNFYLRNINRRKVTLVTSFS